MLPLHKGDSYKPESRIKEKLLGWIRLIFSEKTSRRLLGFLILNLSFAFVELLYGIWTNSLGLISDSFHMFFDCTALLAGLVASVISRWRATETFSYGYVRAEILAGFVNGLFLLFIAFFIFSEAVERAVEPPEVKHERLFVVSVLGFIVNLVGIFAFQHGHSHGGGGTFFKTFVFLFCFFFYSVTYEIMDILTDLAGMVIAMDWAWMMAQAFMAIVMIIMVTVMIIMVTVMGVMVTATGVTVTVTEEEVMATAMKKTMATVMEKKLVAQTLQRQPRHKSCMVSVFRCSHNCSSPPPCLGVMVAQLLGVFLHILADTLGSVGVIISSILIHYFGWMIADPVCSMFIATLIAISVLPLLRDSVGVLMQRTPRSLDHVLPGCYQRVSQLEGVYSVQEPHFWTLCTDVYVGTIKVEVAHNADSRYILSQTHNIFTQVGVRQLYVQVDHAPM
ncbi:Zinc transporter 7 [Plakobranchus ocellatus]|uniref:Zinc transporter 7 n=1 Tax=Plakobranchus ocellatus TaxID=259542 RepID=A0AAV4ASP1_9GAST|nr:Zinc transporter 7 [Plakobranchus ocellatus]